MVVTIDWKWDVLFSNCLQYIVKDGKRDEEWEQVISYPSLSHDKVMIYRRAMLFSTKVTYTKMTKTNKHNISNRPNWPTKSKILKDRNSSFT